MVLGLEMEDAEDNFFNDYLRRNMAKIVTKVKVREIVPHLPSLTESDRENIEAKRENTGNYNAMQLLLSCLRCKDNWLEEFITGLQTCQHSALASQIQEEFKLLIIQPNGSALAPKVPTSGGIFQLPCNPRPISTPKIDEAADLATPLPPEATSGDGILAINHDMGYQTGPSSAVVQSQRCLEPTASLQTHTTEDIGAVSSTILVTPTTHMSSPEVPCPGPQLPQMRPMHDTNPSDKKLRSASDNPADSTKSTVGQVLTEDLFLSQSLVNPPKDEAGVMSSLNIQDVTDGLISPSCMGEASEGEEVCISNPVLRISIHSVQVHQPFDSPSTFPPIRDESAYSGDSVNLVCSSNLSHHSSEIASAETRPLSDAENIHISDKDKWAPDDANTMVPTDAEMVALDIAESVALGHAESEAFSDAARVAPADTDSEILCDTERVACGNIESEVICVAERVALSDIESVTLSEKEVVTPNDVEDVFSGEIKSAIGNVKSFLPEDKNIIVPSDEDGIVSDNTMSIAPENRENVVSDNNEKSTINSKSLVGDHKETIVCDELENREYPESIAETSYCDSACYDTKTSSHNQESVIHDSVGPNDMQNTAADIMETTGPCRMENTAFVDLDSGDPSCTHLAQNVWKENDCDQTYQEISSPDAPSSNHNLESFFAGEADNGVLGEGNSGVSGSRDSGASGRRDSGAPCEGDSRVQVNSENGALCNPDSGAPVEGHREASSEEGNNDIDIEASGEDNWASVYTDGGAPDGGDSGTSGGKEGGAPGERDSGLPADTDSGAPGKGDIGASGEGDGAHPGEGDCGALGARDNGPPTDGGRKAAGEANSRGPQEEDNGEYADRETGVPGKGDNMIPDKGQSGEPGEGDNVIHGEEESRKPEVKNTVAPGEGESGGPAEGDSDATGGIDSRALDEAAIVVPSCTELPQNNSEGNQGFKHLEVNFPASNHIPKNIIPSELVQSTTPGQKKSVVHKDIVATHKELMENQHSSTHTEINLLSSALSNHNPETVGPKGTPSITPGNAEPLHLQTEENHCSAIHLKTSLSPTESFIPSTDSACPDNMGGQSPDNTPEKELAQNHSSSAHQTINLTSPASLNHKPESVIDVDMKSHKLMNSQCSTLCLDITDEQDVEKKEPCMSENMDVQHHTTSSETSVGIITEKRLEPFPEEGQPSSHSPLGSYYIPAAVVGVVAATMLWQLKK